MSTDPASTPSTSAAPASAPSPSADPRGRGAEPPVRSLVDVELLPLSKQNWEAAANLDLADEQREFIAENVWTIAETQFYPWVERRVIVAGGEVVGLAAYGRDHDGGAWWLYRFMIGAEHQRKGYGRAALAALVAEWRARSIARVTVGFHQQNAVAERLYLTAGFVPGPDASWGEKTATLTL